MAMAPIFGDGSRETFFADGPNNLIHRDGYIGKRNRDAEPRHRCSASGVGEPDLPPPAAVIEAVCRAAREGHTHYTHSLGTMPLREAIADWYRRFYKVSVAAECVIVTPGTSEHF